MNNKPFLIALLGLSLSTFTACEKEESIEEVDVFEMYSRPITTESSQYISEVLSYRPGPGQYTNKNLGNIESSESIIGNKTGLVSLGAMGGSIIFTFDHTVINKENENDFIIYGNAFSGFSEPGIVQVSFDENGNGIADDTWYEIAGSAHSNEETLHNYNVTYVNPNSDTEEVIWTDNNGGSGTIKAGTTNRYPLFIVEQEQVTFSGTRIFPTINSGGIISTEPLEWGYVDNYNANYQANGNGNVFDIDWAVDQNLNPVSLQGVDFIKVYTGAQESLGFLGELSTEIKGAKDLALQGTEE
ncbi:PKD domain-containing protein [Wenyingzhuangia sp. chi5]|uniref:PKD domain-containing protein n=1 Tax=Wenyingzhuangia gilva TaxID=3057677 RepID=A0ABT8VSS2_9FLAO|nr:PKD domain-containing protein [Wenyingzhuangia sp. chi5]MDO3695028.1 PKD domain-containing protein [Wenyingzhuangia sp. chi5]